MDSFCFFSVIHFVCMLLDSLYPMECLYMFYYVIWCSLFLYVIRYLPYVRECIIQYCQTFGFPYILLCFSFMMLSFTPSYDTLSRSFLACCRDFSHILFLLKIYAYIYENCFFLKVKPNRLFQLIDVRTDFFAGKICQKSVWYGYWMFSK
eukprot:UN22794